MQAAAAGRADIIRNPAEFSARAPRLAEAIRSPDVARAIIDSSAGRTDMADMADAARSRERVTTDSVRQAPTAEIEVGRVEQQDVAFMGITPDQGRRIMERIPADQRQTSPWQPSKCYKAPF